MWESEEKGTKLNALKHEHLSNRRLLPSYDFCNVIKKCKALSAKSFDYFRIRKAMQHPSFIISKVSLMKRSKSLELRLSRLNLNIIFSSTQSTKAEGPHPFNLQCNCNIHGKPINEYNDNCLSLMSKDHAYLPVQLGNKKNEADFEYSHSSIDFQSEHAENDIIEQLNLDKLELDVCSKANPQTSNSLNKEKREIHYDLSIIESQTSINECKNSIKGLQTLKNADNIPFFRADNSQKVKTKQNPAYLQENETYLRFNKRGWICILCHNFNFESNQVHKYFIIS